VTQRSSKIDGFLQAGLDGFIAEVAALCAQPSVSARSEGTHECAALVAEVLDRHGYDVQSVPTPGNPIVVGRAGGRSDRTLLFYNHYDVQPPEPLELWTSPPYQPTLRDGALYARGAKDDKGEFLARVAAVDAARAAHGGALPCGVIFVVEGEEEIGSPHIAEFVRTHRATLTSHGAVWEEGGLAASGRPEISLGRRGILSVEIEAQTMSRDAHSGSAHILPNAAWRLHRALATLKGPDERILIEGFYDRALPPSVRDLELLAALPDEEAWFRANYGIAGLVGGRTGGALAQAAFEPTCNIGGLTAGYQGQGMKTVIPARASAKLDFRLVPDQDPDDIFVMLRAHLDRQGFGDVVVRRLGAMWPERVSVDDPLVHLTARTAEDVYGVPSQIRPIGGGSSPVYAFSKPLGIPVVTAGVGYAGNRTHAPDEHVRVADFLNAARHLARILDGFATL
jgi:acetylornithine deacetylase/succinyl-diaminopimelate desuccinylase-like protein